MNTKNIFLLFIICFFISFFSLKINAENQFQELYKEQYEKYNHEIEKTSLLIDIYKNILNKKNELMFRLGDLRDKKRRYIISKADALREEIKINEEMLSTLTEALKNINKIKNENAKDFNLDPKYELVILEKRLNELEEKKQELKIKILEKERKLPVWWIK